MTADGVVCALASTGLAVAAWLLRSRRAQAKDEVDGRVGDVDVRATRANGVVEVSAGGVDPAIVLRRQGVAEELLLLVEGPDFPTGDPVFDDDVYVNGPPARLAAAFDAETRRAVQRLALAFEGRVAEGRVRISVAETDTASLQILFDHVVDVARRLAFPPEAEGERLREVALRDPVPGVRRNALSVLARHHPAMAAEVAPGLLADASAEVRLEAACLAGEAGLEHLLNLAAWESGEPEARVRAIRHLAGSPLAAHLRPWLPALRASPVPPVREAALTATAHAGEDGALRILLRHASAGEADEVVAATRALGELGDPAAEDPLVALLGHAVPAVRVAAAEALGRVGTVRAVEPLFALATPTLPGPLKRAARAAVTAIQARAGDVEAGRLSLAEGSGLDGSVAVTEPGRVSVPRSTG